jgi:signal transduction histidine kinase
MDETGQSQSTDDAAIAERSSASGAGAVADPSLEQQLLLEVSQAVSSTLDLGSVLQSIASGTARLAGVETTAVYLFEGDHLFLGATTPPLAPGFPEALRWAKLEDHPHIAAAVQCRNVVVLADAPRTDLSPAERVVVESRGLRSLLFLPFCLEEIPVGVLILGTTTCERHFDSREVNLCRMLTNQLAVSVQNAKLHTSLKGYAAELERQMAEQKRLEDQLRHAQKMEAVGQLAGGVAHDFNNLLQVIEGYASLACDEAPPGGEVSEYLGYVLQASERAGLLVRQLLAFGRRQVLSLAIVDLDQIVEALMPMLRPVLGEAISVDFRRGGPLDPIEADPNQIEQVLVNLCVNARDAMAEGGTIVITTGNTYVDDRRCAELSLPNEGAYVRLEVEDSGCGMSAETMARVFEPFFTTKGEGRGTGLGLATVHGLVVQHRGAVAIHSELGRGTRVTVYLPAAASRTFEPTGAEPAPAARGTETILVVEDEPLVLELTRAFLVAAGYTVLTAASGVEAIEAVDSMAGPVDLAVLDLVLPRLGGEAVLRHLRQRWPGVPVIFASGHGHRARSQVATSERTAFLQKPFGREALLRKVREMLDTRGPG